LYEYQNNYNGWLKEIKDTWDSNKNSVDKKIRIEEIKILLGKAKEKYMGPDYPYYKYIKTTSDIGMSDKGTLSQLGKNIDGLINYVELLVSGGGKASATGQPLGNKFFLKGNNYYYPGGEQTSCRDVGKDPSDRRD
ncbi:MAG: hypothetical protein WCL00_00775, partial [Bacteroidota bacterium]